MGGPVEVMRQIMPGKPRCPPSRRAGLAGGGGASFNQQSEKSGLEAHNAFDLLTYAFLQ